MPRMQRFEFPGSLVHIIARGIDGHRIFSSDNDRKEFLRRLAGGIAECGYKCLCWALLPNHYHLLLRTGERRMSLLMRPLNSGYAQWYNRRHNRTGYLFQDRYKSILCQESGYAKELIRYIHLNPLRAGQVRSLEKLAAWPWCGHGFLLGVKGAPGRGFQERNEALRWFGRTPKQAISSYLAFLDEAITMQPRKSAGILAAPQGRELSGSFKGWPAVVGDPEFARNAMHRHKVARWRMHRKIDYRPVLSKLAAEISRSAGIAEEELFQKGRRSKRSRARMQFCYRAHEEEKLPFSVIAQYLGITITPAVRMARRYQSRNK